MTKSYPQSPKMNFKNHEIYNSYLNSFPLTNDHTRDLIKRGLDEIQISKAQYKTKPSNTSAAAKNALNKISFMYDAEGVPGFYKDKNGAPKQAGVEGLLIPVRDMNGNIISLSVRNDKPKLSNSGKETNKYLAFSSAGKNSGGKVTQTTHCPIINGSAIEKAGNSVRITEGILKADVATALDPDMYCLGMHGLSIPRDLANVVTELEIAELRICLDAGEDSNSDMQQAKAKILKFCEDIGIDYKFETWDAKFGKGIDDVLAAGHKDKIRICTPEEEQKFNKITIDVQGGSLSINATQGEKELIKAGLPIYKRGKKLVRPIIQETDASKGRRTKVAVLHEISEIRMTDYLCQVAYWQRIGFGSEPYLINPPKDVAKTILNRFGAWNFHALSGVILTPTLRPDGSILDKIGYDNATHLYLLDKPEMPPVKYEPTKDDALKSLEMLEDIIAGFPFVDDASKSVALSAMITPIIRGACSVVPMHVISAPTPGTGKSYLLDTVSYITLGQPCPIIAAGKTEEETEKRLGAALLSGQSIISIDNLNGDLYGDALCQIIERPFVTVRILGKSEQVTIESRSTLFANGNNIRLTGDITRRAIQCSLDAKCERPEIREFKFDPVEMVSADRGKYISAILTIIRAYIVAGKPNTIKPKLASFEQWSDLVRSALVWLGRTDPLATIEKARQEDPRLAEMILVFTSIWEATQGEPHTAKELMYLAIEKEETKDKTVYLQPELKEALTLVASDNRGMIDTKRLGMWLGRHKGRVCNGLRLESRTDDHGHAASWWLVDTNDRGLADKSGLKSTEMDIDEDTLPM